MSIQDYSLRLLSRYDPGMVFSIRDRMHKFVLGLSLEINLESKTSLLIENMDIFRLIMYMQ